MYLKSITPISLDSAATEDSVVEPLEFNVRFISGDHFVR